MKTTNFMAVVVLVASSLVTSSCGGSKLVVLLDAVAVASAAAPAAVIALEASGTVSAADVNTVIALSKTVSADTSQAITDAESGKPSAQIAQAVVNDYANVPSSIPGLSPAALAIAQGVISAAEAVLTEVANGSFSSHPLKIDAATKDKLETIRKKCQTTQYIPSR